MKMNVCRTQIAKYADFLKQEERSQATIQKYMRDINCFYRFISEDTEVTKDQVLAYKAYLGANYKINSANSMIAALNGFLSWAGVASLRVKSFKVQKRIFADKNRELNRREYEQLLQVAGKLGKIRLKMIMQTIGATGIRISELSSITVEAVRCGEAVVQGKGKQRVVFITPKLQKCLLRYCREQKINRGVIFKTKNGQAVDRSNVWAEMKQVCRQAGISERKVFPHNLRHLFARVCYKMKKDIVYLADILGHSNIETTRIYTISSGGEHKRLLASLGLVI